MTKEEIMELGLDEIEERANAIALETAEADKEQLETLNAELDAIEERRATLKAEAEERAAAAAAVASGAGKTIEEPKENRTMTNKEIRNSQEYIAAYAKYIRTGKDAECRALLTEGVQDKVTEEFEINACRRTCDGVRSETING